MPRLTVSQRIAQELHKQILRNQFEAGERLPTERDLAIRYGVSRIPVREAMKILEQQGIVETKHGSGNYVKHIDEAKIAEQISHYLHLCNPNLSEIGEIWEILEGHAVTRACKHRTQAQLENMKQLVKDCEAEINSACQGQPFAFIPTHYALHVSILNASGNKMIANLIGSFHRSMSFKDTLLSDYLTELQRTLGVHQALVEAIEKQDAEKAVLALRDDMAIGRNIFTILSRELKTADIFGN